jgi:hypothetical protein
LQAHIAKLKQRPKNAWWSQPGAQQSKTSAACDTTHRRDHNAATII